MPASLVMSVKRTVGTSAVIRCGATGASTLVTFDAGAFGLWLVRKMTSVTTSTMATTAIADQRNARPMIVSSCWTSSSVSSGLGPGAWVRMWSHFPRPRYSGGGLGRGVLVGFLRDDQTLARQTPTL